MHNSSKRLFLQELPNDDIFGGSFRTIWYEISTPEDPKASLTQFLHKIFFSEAEEKWYFPLQLKFSRAAEEKERVSSPYELGDKSRCPQLNYQSLP